MVDEPRLTAVAPCFHCEERTERCHGTCSRYALYEMDKADYYAEKLKQYQNKSDILEIMKRNISKNRRRDRK